MTRKKLWIWDKPTCSKWLARLLLKKIRGFRWSQYDNADYFESFEKILEVLNSTIERVAGIVTSDFSEGAYTRNQSGEITLSVELQGVIVKRLRELLAQPRWENVLTEMVHALPKLETVLLQIESLWTKKREQWITYFCPEWMAISDKIFDKIVKQAIVIIIRKTKAKVSEKNIITQVKNAHYTVKWENITMSKDLEEQIQFQIAQLSYERTKVQREKLEIENKAKLLKTQSKPPIRLGQHQLDLAWRQIAWRRKIGIWSVSWGDEDFPTVWRKRWKQWSPDGDDD